MSFKKYLATVTRMGSLVVLAGLTMANKECKQQPQNQGRQLKKNVRIMGVEASSFLDNAGFKFSEVAQSQLSGVLFQSDNFYERQVYPQWKNNPTSTANFTTPGSLQKLAVQQKVNDEAMVQLKQWFPQMKTSDLGLESEAACMVSRPQHFLHTKINSMEAYGGGGLSLGFSPNGVQLPISGSIKIDKMRMDISASAFDPWSAETVMSHNDQAMKNDINFQLGVPLGPINFGLNFYRSTGMSETTLQALKNVMKGLADKLLLKENQQWSTRVLFSRDKDVVLVGGDELNIKVGDEFKIFNEVYNWSGAPCEEGSQLIGTLPVTAEPWIVRVVSVGDRMSRAEVLNPREDQTPHVGGLVRVHKLFEEKPADQQQQPANTPSSASNLTKN